MRLEADHLALDCRELWAAVIERGLDDARGRCQDAPKIWRPLIRDDAVRWLLSQSEAVGSYLWASQMLGRTAEQASVDAEAVLMARYWEDLGDVLTGAAGEARLGR